MEDRMSTKPEFEKHVFDCLSRKVVKRAERYVDERIERASVSFGDALDDWNLTDRVQPLIDRDSLVMREIAKIVEDMLDE